MNLTQEAPSQFFICKHNCSNCIMYTVSSTWHKFCPIYFFLCTTAWNVICVSFNYFISSCEMSIVCVCMWESSKVTHLTAKIRWEKWKWHGVKHIGAKHSELGHQVIFTTAFIVCSQAVSQFKFIAITLL